MISDLTAPNPSCCSPADLRQIQHRLVDTQRPYRDAIEAFFSIKEHRLRSGTLLQVIS